MKGLPWKSSWQLAESKRGWLLELTVLVGGVLLLSGCDFLKEQQGLKNLAGSWRIEKISVDNVSITSQLRGQYDEVVLTIRKGSESGEFFSLIGEDDGSENLDITGEVDRTGSEIDLIPEGQAGIELEYTIEESPESSLKFRATDGRSEDQILELLRLSVPGEVDKTRIVLSRK